MKVLITGATGFVGQTFLSRIHQLQDFEIHLSSRRPIPNLFNVIIGDLRDRRYVADVLKHEFDQVYHFAWEGIPDFGINKSSVNFSIGMNLLSELQNYPKTEVNFIGSCFEYGSIIGKVSEKHEPMGQSLFAITKRSLHDALKFSRENYRWFRPFYIYGKNQRAGSLIPSLIASARQGKVLELKNPNSFHDFISVDDVCSAILSISQHNDSFGDFNLGTEVLTSVGAIAREVYSTYHLEYSFQESSPTGLVADYSRVNSLTGWQPRLVGILGIAKYLQEMKFMI